MRLPRDLSGAELAGLLARYGYRVSRQTGSHLRLTSTIKPDYHNAQANLADVLAKLGDVNRAIVHSWEAVRLEPANTEDQRFLSAVLERKGHKRILRF